MRINSVKQLYQSIQNGKYAWPGGYPLFWYTSDGSALSYEAVRENMGDIVPAIQSGDKYRGGWCVIGCDVNWEDADLYCDHTGERIESAYAEPESA